MPGTSPQPNLLADQDSQRLPLKFWLLLVLTGVGTGLGAAALMWLLHSVQHLAWSYRTGDFLHAVEHTSDTHRVLVLAIGGAVGAAGLLLRHYVVGGHGGEVAESIWFKGGRFPFLRTCTTAVLSIVIVALGASVGREGAPKQVGAAIASQLSEWFRLTPAQQRLLAACGAGAGMAAVYNVPVGGALFAVEVLLGTIAFPLVIPALATSFIATAVSWVYLPNHPTYSVPSFHAASSQIFWAILFGPVAGLASVVYVRAIVWADRTKPQGWLRVALPVAVFTVLGTVAIRYPQLLGNGKDTAQLAFLNSLDVRLLFILMALKLAATAGCFRSGVPGGLFTPTVTFGALLGGGCGSLWTHFGLASGTGSYAVVGAGAVLAAATQGPVSAIALMLELTYRINGVMIPLLIAICGATLTASLIEPKSIYTARVRFGKMAAVKVAPAVTTAFDQLLCRECDMVSSAARYAVILKKLLASNTSSVYVIDEQGKLKGEVAAHEAVSERIEGPIETLTASDLMHPVNAIESGQPRSDVAQRIGKAERQVPVIDSSGRLLGVVQARRQAGEKQCRRENDSSAPGLAPK